jgi:hypothetical protein
MTACCLSELARKAIFLKNMTRVDPTSVAPVGSSFARKTEYNVRALMTCRGAWQKMIRIQAGKVSIIQTTGREKPTLEREVSKECNIFCSFLGLGQLGENQKSLETSSLSQSNTLQPDCQ